MIVYVGICSLMGSLTVCLSSSKLVHIETVDLILPGLTPLVLAGYERESLSNCFETDIFGYKSIYLLSNMAFQYGCDCLLSSSA